MLFDEREFVVLFFGYLAVNGDVDELVFLFLEMIERGYDLEYDL